MEYIKNRFLKQEKTDIEAFKEYAKICPKNYVASAETIYGTIADVISQNETGGTVLTEIKQRNKATLNYDDIFIEVSKWTNLMKIWRTKGILPIYLNVFKDSKDMYVWILPQLKEAIFHPNVTIYRMEIVDRIGLPWKAAYHIQYDEDTYKIIPPEKEYLNDFDITPKYFPSEILNNCNNETLLK